MTASSPIRAQRPDSERTLIVQTSSQPGKDSSVGCVPPFEAGRAVVRVRDLVSKAGRMVVNAFFGLSQGSVPSTDGPPTTRRPMRLGTARAGSRPADENQAIITLDDLNCAVLLTLETVLGATLVWRLMPNRPE